MIANLATFGSSALREFVILEATGGLEAPQSSRGPLPEYSVIGDQHDYCANHRDEDAVDVNAGRTHRGENPSPDERSDDSQDDVANQPFAGILLPMKPAISPMTIHELAGQSRECLVRSAREASNSAGCSE